MDTNKNSNMPNLPNGKIWLFPGTRVHLKSVLYWVSATWLCVASMSWQLYGSGLEEELFAVWRCLFEQFSRKLQAAPAQFKHSAHSEQPCFQQAVSSHFGEKQTDESTIFV